MGSSLLSQGPSFMLLENRLSDEMEDVVCCSFTPAVDHTVGDTALDSLSETDAQLAFSRLPGIALQQAVHEA